MNCTKSWIRTSETAVFFVFIDFPKAFHWKVYFVFIYYIYIPPISLSKQLREADNIIKAKM